jgi:hypothetical protein
MDINQCIKQEGSHSKFVLEKKFYLNNEESKKYIFKIQIDNCLISRNQGIKSCDWLLVITDSDPSLEIYVELKGNKVDDAKKQLTATLENQELKNNLKEKFYQNSQNSKSDVKKFCYIIASRNKVPKMLTKYQNNILKFGKQQEAQLRIKSVGKNGYFEEDLSKLI